MKALYSFSTNGLKKFGKDYLHMRNYLKEKGCELLVDEIEKTLKRVEKDSDEKIPPYSTSLTKRAQIVSKADVVIIDVSDSTVGIGVILSMAVQMGKPTLMIWKKGIELDYYYQSFAKDASPVLRVHSYEGEKDKEKTIDEFLEIFSPDVRARFNLVYRKDLDNYLEWGAFTYNTTKTQLIISSIEEKRERDELYQKLEKKI